MSGDDEALLLRVAGEMKELEAAGPFSFQSDGVTCFALVGCLQLAWRHPSLSPSQKDMLEKFVSMLSQPFNGKPGIQEVVWLGWKQ